MGNDQKAKAAGPLVAVYLGGARNGKTAAVVTPGVGISRAIDGYRLQTLPGDSAQYGEPQYRYFYVADDLELHLVADRVKRYWHAASIAVQK